MTPGLVEFEFDLPEALLKSLAKIFDTMDGAPITAANVENLPDAQGVYQLVLNGKILYVGKTDGEARSAKAPVTTFIHDFTPTKSRCREGKL